MLPKTNPLEELLKQAEVEAKALGDNFVGSQHIVLAVLKNPESMGSRMIHMAGMKYDRALRHLETLKRKGY